MAQLHRFLDILSAMDVGHLDILDPEIEAPLEVTFIPSGNSDDETHLPRIRRQNQRIEIAGAERRVLHVDDREIKFRERASLDHLRVRALDEGANTNPFFETT